MGKSGKEVRERLGWAGLKVEGIEIRVCAWHALGAGAQVELPGAALVKAHLVQNRYFIRGKILACGGKIADLLRHKDGSAIGGRQITSVG